VEPRALKLPSLVSILSEPELFCLDKLIPEALPLMGAPVVVRLVHLYRLLWDVSFYPSHTFKRFPSQGVLKAGKKKNSHGAM
jgi:hypothetical protein